jgi:histidinol-phosphate aminotransferase
MACHHNHFGIGGGDGITHDSERRLSTRKYRVCPKAGKITCIYSSPPLDSGMRLPSLSDDTAKKIEYLRIQESTFMFEHLITPDVADLTPYPPGKPLEELERELGIVNAVKLASNENPLGPSPKALVAVSACLNSLHRYPDGAGYYLKKSLSDRLGVGLDQIILGNGSDEIIELAVWTFLRPGMNVVMSDPTFLVYSKVVQGASGKIIRVPLRNMTHDLSGLSKKITDDTRMVFLDNPNNPTGSLIPAAELDAFIRDLPRHTILIVDEAYIDFVREGALLCVPDYLDSAPPVLFLRTFSKAYGLAGLRVGYGLAHREIVDYIDRLRPPFNVNTPAQAGARAALDDDDFYRRTRQLVWDGLDWLWSQLDKIGLNYHRSQTNFFIIELERPAKDISDRLLLEGVIARALTSYGLERSLRINAGLPEENERFLNALIKVLAS